jgi:nondiscriminating glutamyl-tRNA synthetase
MTRLRFAPSPTGFVHVGNARTAIFNYLLAKREKGSLVLRIEDTDVERSRKEYEENLILDLRWLGVEWNEGPDAGGDYGPYRQSERNQIYNDYANQLIENDHAYYCFCTAEELEKEKLEAKDSDIINVPLHKCRSLEIEESKKRIQQGEQAAIRFKIPRDTEVSFHDMVRDQVTFDTNLLADPVILRSTRIPAYNFSVVIDDSLMKIDIVVRGEDHISNTARQVLIYQALGLTPPEFAHLSMVMGSDNTKLSKRHGSTSIAQFREQGYLPEALLNYLSFLGWSPIDDKQIMTKQQLIDEFSLEKVSKSSAIFDYQKLKWLNREHIRLLEDSQLAELLAPFLNKIDYKYEATPANLNWIGKSAKILSNYHHLLSDIAENFWEFTQANFSQDIKEKIKSSPISMKVISILLDEISGLESPVDFSKVAEITKKIQKQEGIKGKELYHPIRVALTGKETGIELHDFIPAIETGAILEIEPSVKNMVSRLKAFME